MTFEGRSIGIQNFLNFLKARKLLTEAAGSRRKLQELGQQIVANKASD